MSDAAKRSYSRYALEALELLGKTVRHGRIQRRMSANELAERIGISRGTLQRIEKGGPRVEIGLMVEAAVIVGVKLFVSDERQLRSHSSRMDDRLAVLPKHVCKAAADIDDDF